jgi:hypothetical protein
MPSADTVTALVLGQSLFRQFDVGENKGVPVNQNWSHPAAHPALGCDLVREAICLFDCVENARYAHRADVHPVGSRGHVVLGALAWCQTGNLHGLQPALKQVPNVSLDAV